MTDPAFKRLIEAGDLEGLKNAIVADPELPNKTIVWGERRNESDPLHYVSDCVFNETLDDRKASEVAALLVANGALLEGNQERESSLIAATSLGAENVAKVLIDAGANLEATALFCARPLHWAAAMGLPSTVALLLERGAELEAKCSEFAATPLFWAVVGFGPNGPNKKKDPVSSAKVLLEAGANIDTRNKDGVTALQCAKEADSNDMFELLSQYHGGR